MIYQLQTSVDITSTGIYHGSNSLEKNQQQNFNTVIQTIGLCGNIYYSHPPQLIESEYFQNEKCWIFEWTMEIPDLFKVNDNHIALLPKIFQFVPFIPNLTESVEFTKPVFVPDENIIFNYR
jgi:hypothetical protein